MNEVYLIAHMDETLGELGLILEGMVLSKVSEGEPVIAPSARLVAHDILEHQNGVANIGSIHDELEALGATWYIRGQTGYLGQDSILSPYKHLAFDITRMFRTMVVNGETVKIPENFEINDEYFQEQIDCIFQECDFMSEFDCYDLEEYSDEITKDKINDYKKLVRHYMEQGHKKVSGKYNNQYEALDTFIRIERAVTPYLKPEIEGQRFKISYDNNKSFCEEIYDDEDYFDDED